MCPSFAPNAEQNEPMNDTSNLQDVPDTQDAWDAHGSPRDSSDDQLARELVDRARALGQSWGTRLRAEQSKQVDSFWPGRLQDARMLVERHISGNMGDDLRESLALIVERGARSAWMGHTQSSD